MHKLAVLLTLALGAATLAVPSTAHAETCPDPADQIIAGWFLNEEQILRDTDPFAFSPGATNVAFSHTGYCFPLTLTVERPDGSARHLTVIDTIADGTIGYHQFGWDWFDYATGTGPWRVTRAAWNGITVDLTTPVDFRTTRASVVTLAATPGALPSGPRVTGTVKYWTYQGVLAPSPGRTVWIRQPGWSYPFQPGAVIATTTTDATGRFAVTLPIRTNQQVVADVPRTTTLGFTFTAPVQTTVYQPTSITGYAAPTTATVIHRGTRMSTYGHLSVVYTTGKTGPFANQRVVVQTRPRSNPSAPYTTVASDVTKPSGYYYTNWYASVDVDVRVAFISPYQAIRSSYRWLRVVDVT